MRVLLIGTGGREHALAASLAADPAVSQLICAPGNPGMASLAECRPVDTGDPDEIAALAVDVAADLVVVGPEAPLVVGAADAVRAKGIACFGPSGRAAAIEGSKTFAKDVMDAAGVPTARAATCSDPASVAVALDRFGPPYVVKDDGLAAGKGVVVTEDRAEALAHAARCGTVVVEEFLDGPEVSLFVISDGHTAVPLLPAQDFKRVGEGGTGPNTGGMGAYTPLPWADAGLVDTVMSTVAEPTLAELARRGAPFIGVLYCGLALTSEGPRVIEFNCRFGDPEIQAVLALLETPLAGLLNAAARGELDAFGAPRWKPGAAVCVVIASQGYPTRAAARRPVTGADAPGVLHAGTATDADGTLVSAGGRVLNCVASGADIAEARRAA
ncbi:MAG TPA: phosphoribosylamine--glycine ligase, partial [Stackebrandtia sp.]|uniref:phosphoribosylamine--glycine ligase n=1 Tax=Stackebrandtia sp. TaxID=2023065 RepID=UPI002D501D38